MGWGVVAFLVLANAVTCALLMVGGIWYMSRRMSAQNTQEVYQPTETQAGGAGVSERRKRRQPVADVPRARAAAPKSTAPKSTAPKSTAPKSTAPKSTAPKSTNRRRGLKEFLAPIGGVAGSITDDQRAGIKDLLGKATPTLWLSSAQAHTVLCARDYAEAVVDHRMGSHTDFEGRGRIVRRLTVAVIADDRARDFVVDWAEGRYVGEDGTAPDPIEQEVWTWVQHHAARLMEAEGRYVEAA